MSVSINSNIPRNGLVYGYDQSNTAKSWMGAPTLNLLYDAGVRNWSVATLTSSITETTITANSKYRITSNSASAGTFRFFIPLAKLTNGVTYTLSYKYKIIQGGSNFTMSDFCDVSVTTIMTDYGSYKWSYATGTRATYDSTYRFMDFFIPAYGVVEIWDVQLEVGTLATRFTNGSRTTVDALKDLVGAGTTTVNGLVYSNDAFSFNAAGSLTTPRHSGMDFSLYQTIVQWIRPGVNSFTQRRNPYNQAYGGPGTITHEPVKQFNYYWGTNGGDGTPYLGFASTFTVDVNEWAMISVTRNQPANTVKWYKNGIFSNSTNAGGYAATANGTSPIMIGYGYTGYAYIGDIPMTLVYNRELSADEIYNIYISTRTRYINI